MGLMTLKGFRETMEMEDVRAWRPESCRHSAPGPAAVDTAQPGTIGAGRIAVAVAARGQRRAVWTKTNLVTSTLMWPKKPGS